VQLHHFDPPPPSCPHALCILRLAAPCTPTERKAILEQLYAAEAFVPVANDGEEDATEAAPSLFLVGAWHPRTADEHTAAVAVLRALAPEAAWLFAVTTTIDGVGAEHHHAHDEDDEEDDEDDDEDEDYGDDDYGDDDDDDYGDDDDKHDEHDHAGGHEHSHWLNGPPPGVTSTPFPVDNYPDILEEYDWEDFGIALKLAAPPTLGELEVLEAFHQLWVTAYIDPRIEGVPFRNTAVTYNAAQRAGLLWIDRFSPPATPREIVHHLLWIADRIHTIVPIAHARFAGATMSQKYHALQELPVPPILAGNPLLHAFHDDSEVAALAWAEQQTLWSDSELAAMFVELGTTLDPDDPEPSAAATRMFDRAHALDPSNTEAPDYALQALIRSGRVDEGLSRARTSTEPALRGSAFDLIVEHAPTQIDDALPLLDADTLAGLEDDQVASILGALASSNIDALATLLPRLPRSEAMISVLYNESHKCDDDAMKMRMLDLALEMPVPLEGPHRSALLYAYNNACVHAHIMKDFARAKEIADRAAPYAEENPYIFHGAACAYAAVGELDKAMAQVERAVARDYEHLDRVEVDTDLGELLTWPRFIALFAARRERMAASEPVLEVDEGSFPTQVLASEVPVLVEFTATWCSACERQAPILEQLARTSGRRFRIAKVDIDACSDLAERFGASSVPLLVAFHEGEEVARTEGLSDRAELEAMLTKANVDWDA